MLLNCFFLFDVFFFLFDVLHLHFIHTTHFHMIQNTILIFCKTITYEKKSTFSYM